MPEHVSALARCEERGSKGRADRALCGVTVAEACVGPECGRANSFLHKSSPAQGKLPKRTFVVL